MQPNSQRTSAARRTASDASCAVQRWSTAFATRIAAPAAFNMIRSSLQRKGDVCMYIYIYIYTCINNNDNNDDNNDINDNNNNNDNDREEMGTTQTTPSLTPKVD